MERFDIEARLSDVVAAAEGGYDVEVLRSGTVVATVIANARTRAATPHRFGPADLELLRDVHKVAAPLGVTNAAQLVREMRDADDH